MLVLETDEAHPDDHNEQGSFGQVLDKLFKTAGDNHDPPLGVETTMRFVVEDKEHREGSVPTLEELEGVHAVLITGSMYDAHGDEEWILKLLKLLRGVFRRLYTAMLMSPLLLTHNADIWTKRPDIKLSGVCFGHQLICRMLGSTVESTPGSRWELAHTTMKLSRTGRALFPSQSEKGTLDLHQMHSDHVVNAPTAETSKGLLKPDQKVHVWASTETTDVQGIYIRERAFTTQGHLGFDEDMVKRQIEMRQESGAIEDEGIARQGKEKAAEEHDGEIVAGAILRFFHGEDCDID